MLSKSGAYHPFDVPAAFVGVAGAQIPARAPSCRVSVYVVAGPIRGASVPTAIV